MDNPTTEMTCEACGGSGCIADSVFCAHCDGTGIEPRTVAQDVDECRKAFEEWCPDNRHCTEKYKNGEYTNEYTVSAWLSWKHLWNRRPSVPMSTEVEKAIDRLDRHLHGFSGPASVKAANDFDLIVAALKARG